MRVAHFVHSLAAVLVLPSSYGAMSFRIQSQKIGVREEENNGKIDDLQPFLGFAVMGQGGRIEEKQNELARGQRGFDGPGGLGGQDEFDDQNGPGGGLGGGGRQSGPGGQGGPEGQGGFSYVGRKGHGWFNQGGSGGFGQNGPGGLDKGGQGGFGPGEQRGYNQGGHGNVGRGRPEGFNQGGQGSFGQNGLGGLGQGGSGVFGQGGQGSKGGFDQNGRDGFGQSGQDGSVISGDQSEPAAFADPGEPPRRPFGGHERHGDVGGSLDYEEVGPEPEDTGHVKLVYDKEATENEQDVEIDPPLGLGISGPGARRNRREVEGDESSETSEDTEDNSEHLEFDDYEEENGEPIAIDSTSTRIKRCWGMGGMPMTGTGGGSGTGGGMDYGMLRFGKKMGQLKKKKKKKNQKTASMRKKG